MIESWNDREGSILIEIVEHFSQPGAPRLETKDLVMRTGLDEAEVVHRLWRLSQDGYIKVDCRGGSNPTTAVQIPRVLATLPKADTVTRGQPNALGQSVDSLLLKISNAVDTELNPSRKSALSGLGVAVRTFALEFGPKVASELLARWTKIE